MMLRFGGGSCSVSRQAVNAASRSVGGIFCYLRVAAGGCYHGLPRDGRNRKWKCVEVSDLRDGIRFRLV